MIKGFVVVQHQFMPM